MIEELLRLFDRGLDYAQRLVADVPDEQMADQPAPGMNHPAWTLGHLVGSCDTVLTALGQPARLPPQWRERYGRDTHPSSDRGHYESKDELVAAFVAGHEAVAAALRALDAKELAAPSPERYVARFPTKLSLVMYMLLGHEMTHLGQLSVWRRVRGMPSV